VESALPGTRNKMGSGKRRPGWARRSVSDFLILSVCCLLLCGAALAQAPAAAPAAQRVDWLIAGGTVVTMDANHRIVEDGAIAIRGDAIIAVGSRAELEARYHPTARLEARGKLVMPGLINGHTHVPMTLFRGLADDLALDEWLHKYIFPAEARNVTPDFVRAGARLGVLEMLRGGITTYVDMYYFEDEIARVTKQAGMRAVLGETILDFPAPDNKNLPQMLRYTEDFLKHWKGDPLIVAAVAPHAPYTCSAETLRAAAELARRYGAPIVTHVSETKPEVEESRAKHGMSPVAYLDSLGLLGPDLIAAHCVWVDAADIALLARRGVGCVHNPSSNMKLASGISPVVEMLAAGVRVGLGTDGAASNNDLDLMEEIDLAAKLQKIARNDPRALPAEQAIELATIGGARALHMERQIGSLEAGKKADVIVVRLDQPHAVPMYNVYSHLVYALKASDVETAFINGKRVMAGRRVLTLDEADVVAAARRYAKQVQRNLTTEASAGHEKQP
jgi:5-methylthioadenosine/S-adenosylhomocysteine deaminase